MALRVFFSRTFWKVWNKNVLRNKFFQKRLGLYFLRKNQLTVKRFGNFPKIQFLKVIENLSLVDPWLTKFLIHPKWIFKWVSVLNSSIKLHFFKWCKRLPYSLKLHVQLLWGTYIVDVFKPYSGCEFTNVGISPKNLLAYSFNSFSTLV